MLSNLFIALMLCLSPQERMIPPIEVLNPKPVMPWAGTITFPSISIFNTSKVTYVVLEYKRDKIGSVPKHIRLTKDVSYNVKQTYVGKLKFSNRTNNGTEVYTIELPKSERLDIGQEFKIEVFFKKRWEYIGYIKVEKLTEVLK